MLSNVFSFSYSFLFGSEYHLLVSNVSSFCNALVSPELLDSRVAHYNGPEDVSKRDSLTSRDGCAAFVSLSFSEACVKALALVAFDQAVSCPGEGPEERGWL